MEEREREPGGGLLTCERFSLACARFVRALHASPCWRARCCATPYPFNLPFAAMAVASTASLWSDHGTTFD